MRLLHIFIYMNFILSVAELYTKCIVTIGEVRALLGKEWDPRIQHGDLWANSDETEDIELFFSKYC